MWDKGWWVRCNDCKREYATKKDPHAVRERDKPQCNCGSRLFKILK